MLSPKYLLYFRLNYPTQEWNIPSYLTKGINCNTHDPNTHEHTIQKKTKKDEPHLSWKWVHPSLIPPPYPPFNIIALPFGVQSNYI
jgi:hypothetical protein